MSGHPDLSNPPCQYASRSGDDNDESAAPPHPALSPRERARAAGGDEFLAAAGDLLLADEVRHNLIIGVAGRLHAHRRPASRSASACAVASRPPWAAATVATEPPRELIERRRAGQSVRAQLGTYIRCGA